MSTTNIENEDKQHNCESNTGSNNNDHHQETEEILTFSSDSEIICCNFEELPLEIRAHILMYSSDRALIKFGMVSKLYYSLLLSNDDDFSAIRNTIWKERLLNLLNRWIDNIDSIIINNGIDTSQLEKLTIRTLDSYLERNVIMREDYSYRHLISHLKSITFKPQKEAKKIPSETGVMINKRSIRNNNLKEWNCFISNNYCLSPKKLNNPISWKGYEIIIHEFYECANTWRLVYGIGTDYENFNVDASSTQFLLENNGIGLVIENQYIKSFGRLNCDTNSNIQLGPIKVGDRYALQLDFETMSIYFFKNGLHFLTYQAIQSHIDYHPIIALCPKKSVTLYPLLSDYSLNPNAPLRRINCDE